MALFGPVAAARYARPLVLNFGPNDAEYVQGFREDWERDGRTLFHWTSPTASVRLPFALEGEGFLLRMRVRRHLIEPAIVTLSASGALVARFPLQADPKLAYQLLEIPLPRLEEARGPFALLIQTRSESPRPLGIAMDWLELARTSPAARLVVPWTLRWRWLAVLVATFVALRGAGLSWRGSSAAAALWVVAGLAGLARDPLAAERILRQGALAYVFVAALSLAAVRVARTRSVLGPPSSTAGGILVLLVLVALTIRLVVLLHPQFFYPDVRVHALFARELAKRGLVDFLRSFTANQFRFSLGLQFENGHWYAFPYPAAFYVLCWPLVRALRYLPEVAVSLVAAVVNSLEVFLVYGIARRLSSTSALALGAAAVVPVLPLFMARLTLAYFPAIVGHAVDALVILYLVARLGDLDRPRVVLALAGLIAAALLTYTQSLLNFAVLLPLFLLLQAGLDRTTGARRRMLGLAAAGTIGALLAFALFYARYVPVFLDMRRGVPMAEEAILLEKIAHQPPTLEPAAPDVDDVFAGPGVHPIRGLRKAAWRLYVFYWLFAPIVVVGVVGLQRSAEPAIGRFVAAWAVTYVLLNLLSGGLSGPNLFRYNKDLEVVAPLCCAALGAVAVWLWPRARPLAVLLAAAFWTFGMVRAVGYFASKVAMER